MTITVLLVDDQSLFREGLRTILSVHDEIEVIGEAENGEAAITAVANLSPQVVLMDVRMPLLDGVAATRKIKSDYPKTRVILLTTFDDDEYVFEGLRAGAAGYLLKDVPSQKLIEAIQTAAQGETFLHPSVAAKVVAEFTRIASPHEDDPNQQLVEPLSERELEILTLVGNGASNKEIAAQLFIAEGTVKNHLTNILGKLGVRDRTQAALKARSLGII